MIVKTKVTRDHDRHCSCCAAYRKPNYTELTFYRLNLSISRDSNGLIITLCNECADDMIRKLSNDN